MDRTSRHGTLLRTGLAVLACSAALGTASAAPKLDLSGYTDASGAITVQHRGDTVDPYFALQALWLAQTRGLDISDHALPWARWLAQHYTAAGHLGRYCKTGEAWHWCKAPDGDDASLALWLHLLRNMIVKAVIRIGAGYFERDGGFFLIGSGSSGADLRRFTLSRLALALNGLRSASSLDGF